MLPIAFEKKMKKLLGAEYDAFQESFQNEHYQALRFNPLKGNLADFLEEVDFSLRPVPWAENGFYYDGQNCRPGKHPFHEAGVYYIQEPSAMVPGALLEAKPGEYILDLCAAPGGKTTQIASSMKQEGLLISNEIHPARAKILAENVERMGIQNAIVTNESPERLAKHFPLFFDRIMVDAPCSGEGMFRKNEDACTEWSPENVALCAERQAHILDCAASMLVPGGHIVYSTCTFSPEENEGSIQAFLERHPNFQIEEASLHPLLSHGHPEWVGSDNAALTHSIRIWPHKVDGEGHFACVLKKEGTPLPTNLRVCMAGALTGERQGDYTDCISFLEDTLIADHPFFTGNKKQPLRGNLVRFGDQLYLTPENCPSVQGLKVLRLGLHLGTVKKNRFEPAHALALSLQKNEVRHAISIDLSQACHYIQGETFPSDLEKGWYLICVEEHSLAWGKLAGGMVKNHYPKGLRKNLL